MGKISFDRDDDNAVTPQYSDARGPVLRSERIEVTKAMFDVGKGAKTHSHAEEQVFYIVEGRLRVTCDGETYEVRARRGKLPPFERRAHRAGARGHRRDQLQEPRGSDLREDRRAALTSGRANAR